MKKRLKKIYSLNKKYAIKYRCEINCIVCGLGYDRRKRRPRRSMETEAEGDEALACEAGESESMSRLSPQKIIPA